MFEYIGEMGKDYIYAVTPLLEDALIDRDLVHRQTAAAVVRHIAHGVPGLGCEDALRHLLNFVWPNIFEDTPHIVYTVHGAVDGMRLSLGPAIVLTYTLQARHAAPVRLCSLRAAAYACFFLAARSPPPPARAPPTPPPPTPHPPAQGLFHPARKVRQTYWKVYNNLYIGAQDALVAFAPRVPDAEDGANAYVRHELDLMI